MIPIPILFPGTKYFQYRYQYFFHMGDRAPAARTAKRYFKAIPTQLKLGRTEKTIILQKIEIQKAIDEDPM